MYQEPFLMRKAPDNFLVIISKRLRAQALQSNNQATEAIEICCLWTILMI
jgi:hypothetical protein